MNFFRRLFNNYRYIRYIKFQTLFRYLARPLLISNQDEEDNSLNMLHDHLILKKKLDLQSFFLSKRYRKFKEYCQYEEQDRGLADISTDLLYTHNQSTSRQGGLVVRKIEMQEAGEEIDWRELETVRSQEIDEQSLLVEQQASQARKFVVMDDAGIKYSH